MIECALSLVRNIPDACPLLCSWPERVWMQVADARSHTHPVPSALPVMARRPSASTSAQFTCAAQQASAVGGHTSACLTLLVVLEQQARKDTSPLKHGV